MSDPRHNKDSKRSSVNRDVVAKIVRASGTVVSNPREGLKTVIDYVADKIEGNANASLMAGLEYLNKKGNISNDFLDRPVNRYFVLQIQADIRGNIRNEWRLNQKIETFLAIASGELVANDIEVRKIWKVIDGLTEPATALIAASYKTQRGVSKGEKAPYQSDVNAWADFMAKESGLNHRPFVFEAEQQLMHESILDNRVSSGGTVSTGANCRLTPLGLKIAEYLEKGQEILMAAISENNVE